jgi:hypothetical protein
VKFVLCGCKVHVSPLYDSRLNLICVFVCINCNFGPKREEDGSWKTFHNDELHNLYSSPNIVSIIKSRRLRFCGTCGTHGGGERCLQGFDWEARR